MVENFTYVELIVEDMGKAGYMKEWVQGKVIEERNLRNTWGMFEGDIEQ